jgi:hypothetical protein
MTDRLFAWLRPDGKRVEGDLDAARAAAAGRIKQGTGPFDITQDGDPIRRGVPRVKALDVLAQRLRSGDVGPVYRVKDGAGRLAFQVREVKAAPDVIDTSGNDHADAYWTALVAEYGAAALRFAGAYVCKSIVGSGGTPSQHSYGNAVDVFFSSMAAQERAFAWVIAHADELNIEHVISGDRIWTRGEGIHAYTGEFHRHLHADFAPQFSGPCGVRQP